MQPSAPITASSLRSNKPTGLVVDPIMLRSASNAAGDFRGGPRGCNRA